MALWVIIALLIFTLFNMFQGSPNKGPHQSLAFSDFIGAVDSGDVRDVTIQGKKVTGHYGDGREFRTYLPDDPSLIPNLSKKGVHIKAVPTEDELSIFGILISWFPMLLLIGVWIFFMRQMQGGGGKAMGFGKSKAKLLTEKTGRITFEDVAGIDEAKQELEEIVDFLKDPGKFERLGGEIPRGVLLMGEPGTGKTLLAKAIAGEAAVPFFSISGSDFVEMFVGVGASRVRDMFAQGKKHAPCIIFIDEIDAVGRSRGAGLGGGNDEREQTLNQLLVEMDGFEVNEGIIVVAATNRPDVLDHALLRPGRFDRQVVVPSPDIKGRENILKTHSKKIELDKKVSLKKIARGTPGFTGADLANLVNEAALWAARQDKETVDNDDFEYARDKVMMGAERRSLLISDEEKETTAYHEVGHALVAASIEEVDPVHKVSIIPRGRALGVTMLLPEEDRHSHNKRSLLGQITMTMGGRAAEHLVFKRFTTGASDDLKRATELARKMVCQWGMSEKLGPLTYTEDAGHVFLGRDLQQHTEFSNESMRMIDEEVLEILNSSYERAKSILRTYRKALESLALTLLEKETIDGENVMQVMEEFSPKTKK